MRDPLMVYWLNLNFNLLNKIYKDTPGMELVDIAEMAREATYIPINTEFCIVMTDDVDMMMRAVDGVIVSQEEAIVWPE